MDEKKLTKKEKKEIKKRHRKETREHNISARKEFRKDHPIGWRVNNFIKNLIKKNK